jgi:hypothetical protein
MAPHALPRLHHAPRWRPSLRARLLARWHGPAFDAALAAGADPATDARLTARAAQLVRPHHVQILVEAIDHALEDAERRKPIITAAVPVRKNEVLGAYDELLALAAALQTRPHPSPRALALSHRLLLDGTSPLFDPQAAGTLKGAVREALLAFDADHQTYPRAV